MYGGEGGYEPPSQQVQAVRVGGGYEYIAVGGGGGGGGYGGGGGAEAVTSYETFKALPPPSEPYTQFDVDVMAEILRTAEATAQREGTEELTLMKLLKAYEAVLRRHGMVPNEDTYYYRFLLKLSLDPDPDWWAKLNRECLYNARRLKGMKHRNLNLLSTAWSRWKEAGRGGEGEGGGGGGPPLGPGLGASAPVRGAGSPPMPRDYDDDLLRSQHRSAAAAQQPRYRSPPRREYDTYDYSRPQQMSYRPRPKPAPAPRAAYSKAYDHDLEAYAEFKMLASCFRVWRRHAVVLRQLRVAREHAVENWMIGVSFWEARTADRFFQRWRAHGEHRQVRALSQWLKKGRRSRFYQWLFGVRRIRLCRELAATHNYARLVSKSLRSWREFCLGARDLTTKLYAAMLHWRCIGQSRAYALWCEHMEERAKWRAEKVERGRKIRMRLIMRWWLKEAKERGRLGRNMRDVASAADLGTKIRFYARWRAMFKIHMRHQEILGRCFQRMRERSLGMAFRQWRSTVQKDLGDQWKVQQMLLRIINNRLHMAMQRWKEWQREESRMRGKFTAVIMHMQFSRVSRAMYKWMDFVQAQHDERERLKHCVMRIKHGMACRILNEWHTLVVSKGELVDTAHKVVRRLRQLRAYQAFTTWREWYLTRLRHQTILAKCLQRLMRKGLQKAFDSWMTYVGEIQMLRQSYELASSLPNRMLRSYCYKVWKGALAQVRRTRVCVYRIRSGCAVRCLRQWRDVMREARLGREKVALSMSRIMKRGLVSAFNTWRQNVDDERALRDKMGAAFGFMKNRTLAQAFNTWREHFLFENKLNEKLEAAVRHLCNRDMAAAFNKFRENMEDAREFNAKIQRAARHWHLRAAAIAMTQWEAYVQERRFERAQIAQAVAHLFGNLQAKAFSQWLIVMDMRHEYNEALKKSLGFWANRSLAQALTLWYAVTQQLKGKKARLNTVLKHMANRNLAMIFARWVEVIGVLKEKNQMAVKALRHLTQRCTSNAFGRWVEAVEETRAEAHAASKAMSHFLNSAMWQSWQKWWEHVEEQRELRDKLRKGASHFVNRELSRAFACFADNVADAKAARAALSHFMGSAMARSFGRWVDFIDEKKDLDDKLAKAAGAWTSGSLARAWGKWWSAVEYAREGREKVRMSLARIFNRMMVECFNSWVDFVPMAKEERMALVKASNFFLNRAAMVCIETWRDNTREARNQRRALSYFTRGAFSRCFGTWRANVREMHEDEHKMERAFTRFRNVAISQAFYTWHGAVREKWEMEDKLERCMKFWSGKALGQAWGKWCEVMAEKFEMDEKLQRALSRWSQQSLAAGVEAFKDNVAHAHKARHALAYFTKGASTRCFTGWRKWLTVKREMQLKGDIIMSRWFKLALAEGFNSWLCFVEDAREQRHKAGHALRFFTHRTSAAAWNTWREFIAAQAKRRSAFGFFYSQATRGAFNRWRDFLAEKQELGAAINRAMGHWVNKAMIEAFATWQDFVLDIQEERVRVGKGLQHWLKRAMAGSFLTWHDVVVESVARRAKVAVSLARIQNRYAIQALLSWRDLVGERGEMREKARKSMSFFTNKAASSAFAKWVDVVDEAKRHREIVAASLTKICNREMNGAFCQMRAYVDYKRRSRMALTHRKRTLCRKAFGPLYRKRHCAHVLAVSMAKVLNRTMANAWSAWREMIEYLHEKKGQADHVLRRIMMQGCAKALAAFADNVSRNQRLRGIMVRIQLRAASSAFDTWRTVTINSLKVRDRLSNMMASMKEKCFLSWAEHARDEYEVRVGLAVVEPRLVAAQEKVAELCLMICGRWYSFQEAVAFQHWKKFLADREHERALARVAYDWLYGKLARLGLEAFVENAMDARKIHAARSFCLMGTVGRPFNHWRQVTEEAHQLRGKSNKALLFWAGNVVNAVLIAWLAAAKENARKRTAHARAIFHYASDLRTKAFKHWMELRGIREERTAMKRMVLGSMAGWRLQMVFRSWWELAIALRELRLALDDLYCRCLSSRLREWLYDWFDNVQETRRHRVIIMGRMFGRYVGDAFNAWRDYVALERQVRQNKGLALKFYAGRLEQLVFTEWRSLTHIIGTREAKVRKALLRICAQVMAHAWIKWWEAVQDSREMADKTSKAMSMFINAALGKAFNMWVAAVEEAHAARRALRHLLNRTLLLGWNGFVACVEEKRENHDKAQAAIYRLKNRVAISCFQSWAEEVAHEKERRSKVTMAIAKRMNRSSAMVFTSWAEYTAWSRQTGEKLKQATARLINRALSEVFDTWAENAADQRHARRAMSHFGQRTLRLGWAVFAEHHEMVRRERDAAEDFEKMELAAIKAFGSVKKKAFESWKRVYENTKKVLTNLARLTGMRKAECFRGWRQVAVILRAQSMKGGFLAQNSLLGAKSRLFSFWIKAAKAHRFFRLLNARRVFYTWREWAAERKAMMEKARHAMLAITQGCMLRCFYAWRDLARIVMLKRLEFQRRQKAVRDAVARGDQMIKRRRRELVVGSFEAWRLMTHKFRMLADYLAGTGRLKMQKCLRQWADTVAEMQEERHKTAESMHFYDRMLLKKMLRMWKMFGVMCAGENEAKLRKVLEFTFGNLAGRSFDRWIQYVELQHLRRKKLVEVFSHLTAHDRRGKLAYALSRWRDLVDDARRLEAKGVTADGHYLQKRLVDCFTVWATFTAAMRNMEIGDDVDLSRPVVGDEVMTPGQASADRRLIQRFAIMAGHEAVTSPGEATPGRELYAGLEGTAGMESILRRRRHFDPYISISAQEVGRLSPSVPRSAVPRELLDSDED